MINTLSHSVIMFNQLKTNKKNPNEIETSNLRILLDQAKLILLHIIYYSLCMKNKLQYFFLKILTFSAISYYIIHVLGWIFFFRILKDFLDEFHRVLTTKLAVAKQSTDEIETNLDRLATELGKLENSRKEVTKKSD